MTNTKEFSYTIEKHFGTVSVAGSLPLELNLVSFAGAPARYDLRKWRDKANGEHTMQKGITLTLNSEEGKKLFLEMVKKADVVVENYRPGVMDKLGVGYDVLKEVNDQIIYAAVSGLG